MPADRLRLVPGLDEHKFHVRSADGVECARVQQTPDRVWIVYWGPLLRNEQVLKTLAEAVSWLHRHESEVEWGV